MNEMSQQELYDQQRLRSANTSTQYGKGPRLYYGELT